VLVLVVLSLTVYLSCDQKTAKQISDKGVEYAAQGNFNEVKEQFEKALKVDPVFEPAKGLLKLIEDAIEQKIKNKTAIHYFKGIVVRVIVMQRALSLKFNQNPNLKEQLIKTGEAQLVEGNYWHDNFWGNCFCDQCEGLEGENKLGVLLMELRDDSRRIL
jgi:hypothetical protein